MQKLIMILIALHGTAAAAFAQGHAAGQGFVAARVGANLIGNTYRVRDVRPEPGAGGSIGAFVSPYWAVEFETWMRAANPECCGPRRHEMLYSLSAMRLLAHGRWQPYMLSGLTLLRGDDPEMQVQVAVGALFPVYRRMSMAIDMRGNGGSSTMIVRPTVALIYYFR